MRSLSCPYERRRDRPIRCHAHHTSPGSSTRACPAIETVSPARCCCQCHISAVGIVFRTISRATNTGWVAGHSSPSLYYHAEREGLGSTARGNSGCCYRSIVGTVRIRLSSCHGSGIVDGSHHCRLHDDRDLSIGSVRDRAEITGDCRRPHAISLTSGGRNQRRTIW